jgi:hypothetical protein
MITLFTIGVSHTINLGHYESMKVEASVTVDTSDVEPDAFEEAKRRAQAELHQLIVDTYQAQKRKNDERGDNSF